MQANEMRDYFHLLWNAGKVNNVTFDDREVSAFLNIGQKEFVDDLFTPDSNIKGKGFEADRKRQLQLSPLIKANVVYIKGQNTTSSAGGGDFVRGTYYNGAKRSPDQATSVSTGYPYDTDDQTDTQDAAYGVFVPLSTDVLYIIDENCDISTTDSSVKGNAITDGDSRSFKMNVRVEEITNEQYNETIYNTLKQPYGNLVWRREHGNTISTYKTLATWLTSLSTDKVNYRASNSLNATPVYPNINKWKQTELTNYDMRIVQLIPGSKWEIEKYNIYYVQKPRDIVVDKITPNNQVNCELNKSVHLDIVRLAVKAALEASIPYEQKYQVTDKEVKESE